MKKIVLSLMLVILLVGVTACGREKFEDLAEKDLDTMVVIGDSITEGFSFNKILPEEIVMAGAGATVGYIHEEYMEKLIDKNPNKIFIMLGSDDLLMPVDEPKKMFIDGYRILIEDIKKELPESKVYVQSITRVTDKALEAEPRYGNIDEYNQALIQLAEEVQVKYLDIDTLLSDNQNLYAEDGIHLKKEFYNIWLDRLLEEK